MSSQPLGKLVERALRKAVSRQVSHTDKRARLEAVMDKTVELAMEGEQWAVQFIGDRLDGKARQQLEVEINNRMTIVIGHSGAGTSADTIDASPILDVDQDGATAILPSRVTKEETEPLPPPEPYSAPKAQQHQHVTRDPRQDGGFQESAQERIARIRARSALQAAPVVPVDGVRGDGSDEAAVHASPYACVHAATDKRAVPCAVCTRIPACPRHASEAP